MAISNITHYELEQIIDHIESALNKPAADMMMRQLEERQVEAPPVIGS